MTEETEILERAASVPPANPPGKGGDSSILNVSVRAWLVLVIIGTLCLIELFRCALAAWLAINGFAEFTYKVEEPFYSVVGIGIGFFFGQKQHK